jgi:hypothetical protein
MICLKTTANKDVYRTSKVLVSRRLADEIERMQELLETMYLKKYRRKKHIPKIKVSDYVADICRDTRYKLQNGRT